MSHPDYKDIGSIEVKATEEASELIVELGLLVKDISKMQRFGFFNHHPEVPEIQNYQYVLGKINSIRREWGDVYETINALEDYIFKVKEKGEEGDDSRKL